MESHLSSRIRAVALVLSALTINAYAGPGDWSGQGPFGGGVNALAADPTLTSRLYAATGNGFFRSDDAGTTWSSEESGFLAPHPTNPIFGVSGANSGGLWMFDDSGRLYGSSDAGNNWIPTGFSDPSFALDFFGYGGYGLAEGASGTVWYAARTGGLLVSRDNGATFASPGAQFAGSEWTVLATNPSDPQHVIYGDASQCEVVSGACPIYISSDNGNTWTPIPIPDGAAGSGTSRQLIAAAFGPGNNVYALYGNIDTGVGRLLSSTNNGATWTAHVTYGIYGILLNASRTEANKVWISSYESTDGGDHFTALATTGRTTNGVFVPTTNSLAVATDNATSHRVWIGTSAAGVYASNDDGTTWTSSNDGMAASDIRTVVVDPADDTRLFAGYSDSLYDPSPAVYRSTTTGSWTISNSGLNAYQVRTILIDPTTAATPGGMVVYAVGSGFDTTPPTTYNSGVYKSTDGGLTWATQAGGFPARGLGHNAGFLRTIIADPRSCDTRAPTGSVCTSGPLKTLYATGSGTQVGGVHQWRVLKSTDAGVTWASSETGLPADIVDPSGCPYDAVGGITPIVMDPTDSRVLYIGTFSAAFDQSPDGDCDTEVTPHIASGVYKSVDSGSTWTIMSTGLPTYTGSISVLDTLSLAIDPSNPQALWVSTIDNSFSPDAPGQIYKTTNGGTSWSLSNAGITGPDVRALLADPTNPGTVYAASGGLGPANPGGVYKSTDGGATWMSISVGLPAFSATALTLDPIDSTVLYAGTSGGVYSIVQLPDDDADGVPDLIENAGPNGGDANHDNQQDSQQNFVGTTAPGLFGGYGWTQGIANASQSARSALLQQKIQSLKTQPNSSGIEGGYFTVQVGGGCTQAVDVAPINPGPLGVDAAPAHHGAYSYPRGLLRFELPQCTAATVDLTFNASTFGPGWSWRFYGPSTPGDNSTMGWYDASALVTKQLGTDWQIQLANGSFGSYRPAITHSILFEGGPAYDDTIFNDNLE